MTLGVDPQDGDGLMSEPVTTVKMEEPSQEDDLKQQDEPTDVVSATIKNVKKMVADTEAAAKDVVVKATINKWLPVILLVGAYYLSKGRRR